MSEQLQPYNSQALMQAIGANALVERKWDEIVTSDTISYPLADIS